MTGIAVFRSTLLAIATAFGALGIFLALLQRNDRSRRRLRGHVYCDSIGDRLVRGEIGGAQLARAGQVGLALVFAPVNRV